MWRSVTAGAASRCGQCGRPPGANLAAVIDTWLTLPDSVKAGVPAMVKAATDGGTYDGRG